ncbi:hypothetical protein C8J56DRAFT_565359 [Mycena floridula]|nr:hypothetical protein C8J56DRAFT_565359 [Mycena floridula]
MTFPTSFPTTFDGHNYDGVNTNRMSRRQSFGYGAQPTYGYDQGQGMYGEPMSPMAPDYPQPSYPIYAPHTAPMHPAPQLGRMSSHAYDDMRDGYFDGLAMPPAPLTPNISMPRHRRHSTVSFSARPTTIFEPYRRAKTFHLKFKRKGSILAGISLADAQNPAVRLSSSESYSLHDMHADRRSTIHLKVKWSGYNSLTFEIPLDSYDGRISLQTLARRVSRACVHYIQANFIPVSWDRVDMHHLEEISYGVWQPMLSTR